MADPIEQLSVRLLEVDPERILNPAAHIRVAVEDATLAEQHRQQCLRIHELPIRQHLIDGLERLLQVIAQELHRVALKAQQVVE